MHETTLTALRAMRPFVLGRWELLLRTEPVLSPLVAPDNLVYLMKWTWDEIFVALRKEPNRRNHRPRDAVPVKETCRCGVHPLSAYFSCMEKAFQEAFLIVSGDLASCTPAERNLAQAELQLATRSVAQREIEMFCAVCQRGRSAVSAVSTHHESTTRV